MTQTSPLALAAAISEFEAVAAGPDLVVETESAAEEATLSAVPVAPEAHLHTMPGPYFNKFLGEVAAPATDTARRGSERGRRSPSEAVVVASEATLLFALLVAALSAVEVGLAAAFALTLTLGTFLLLPKAVVPGAAWKAGRAGATNRAIPTIELAVMRRDVILLPCGAHSLFHSDLITLMPLN